MAWLRDKCIEWGIDRAGHWVGLALMKILSGVEFFENRMLLERHRHLDSQLGKAKDIKAILMSGRKLREQQLKNLRHVTKVILPRPGSDSAKHYALTVDDESHFHQNIIETTKYLQDSGIEVKWYEDIIFHSILIGDADETIGWAHVETNLPYSKSNLRHSITLYRNKNEGAVLAYRDIFNKMWKTSEPPNLTEGLTHLTNGHVIAGHPSRLTLEFAEDISGCRVATEFTDGTPATFYRIKVRNDTGDTQKSCRGRIVAVKKKNIIGVFEEYGFNEQLQLTWGVHTANGPPLVTDIPNRQEKFLDLLFITPLGRVCLATQGFVAPNSMPHPFADEGEYLLTVNVTSEKSFLDIQLIFCDCSDAE